jgi:hypothetical protein
LTYNTADSNTANGFGALYNNTTGASNSAVGRQALYLNTTGSNNTSVGIYSSEKNTTGTGNAALGYAALYENTTGNNNIAVGLSAGRFIDDGTTANTVTSNSVFLGHNTKALADSQTNQIVIGDTAVGLGSNTAILGNSSITKTQLQGNVGIGTDSPGYKLSVAGTIQSNAGTITGYPLLEQLRMMYDQDGNYWKFETTAGPGADLLISQNATPFLVVKSGTGRVGIGTTIPDQKLVISGTNNVYSKIVTSAANSTLGINGNVGIGTASPVSNLHVFEGSSGESFTNLYGLAVETSGTSNSYHAMQVATGVGTVFDITNAGNVGIGTATPIGTNTPKNKLDIVGSLGRGAPVTKTTDFTVAATENWLIMNGTATITITLPTASSFTGRELMIKNIAAYTVISASSNVKPIDTDTAATAILPATAGSWCTLVSDGTNWVTMMN